MEEDSKKNSTDKTNKTNKILLGVVIALAVVIVVLLVILIAGIKGKSKKNSDTTEATTVATASDADDEKAKEEATKTDAEEKNSSSSSCYVKVTNDNSWENGDNYCGGLSISIVNDTDEELKDWKIEMDIKDGFVLDGSWNGNFEVKDNLMTITAVDYNGTIPANGELKDIGCNVTTASKEDLDALTKNARLYIGDKLYEGEAASEKQTTEATTEAKTTEAEAKEKPETDGKTPVDAHGKLSVEGTDIVDENGDKYQLKGLSTHGIAWFPDYVNKEAFQTFRDDWDANLIRLAMYTDENDGYCAGGDQDKIKGLVESGVEAATELGMYVIIDWHVLHDLTPMKYKDEAISFFDEMSAKYADYDNVIYEICNEPNGGTEWSEVKSYAEEVIPVIRANDKDAIIIVGTPNWSQDVDVAADDPITGYDNIMYAIHFYAATHTDSIRSKVKTAHDKGLPVFVSEYSICDASGAGAIDYTQAEKWFDMIDEYNLSYSAWNISNKDETSSIIKSSCSKTSGWTDDDYSDAGTWIKNQMTGN